MTGDPGGALTHRIGWDEDLGGRVRVIEEPLLLSGWPTPAMRRVVQGNGDPAAWYVGTDERGVVIPARAP